MFDATNFGPEPYPINRRSNPRYRTYLHGKVVFEADGLSADCTIRNLSQIGAKIEIKDAFRYPDNPTLIVTKTGLLHKTTTVWLKELAFGLRFDSTIDLATEMSATYRDAHRLWMQHRAG